MTIYNDSSLKAYRQVNPIPWSLEKVLKSSPVRVFGRCEQTE